ncbi:hypothetical protein [Pantoea agglomerans]|uniref:hypothetical protein n=1 Tax=Enterobacter agglomerans TaxID=549 RepID=UPI0013B5FCB3|nr:hypothetical protein [Pantoea agglomerans]NEG58219.1 hypothetical protein [Pantoea agglomerans]NEG99932.1 hypothetical protein [Pantoea agglomerans]NEH04105.1 hypothetical protein [Pantoea agglomerans]NEH14492.1 hypothetical protein [Pantoea agglomerans]
MEKISFSYASRIFPGMMANVVNAPDSLFLVSKLPESISFYVYAGLILEKNKAYNIGVDVLFDGASVIEQNETTADSSAHHVITTDQDDFVSISCTWISQVKFLHEGMYEIVVALYSGRIEDETTENLDKHTCHILVRKGAKE